VIIPNSYWLDLIVQPSLPGAYSDMHRPNGRGILQEPHMNAEEGYGPGHLTDTGYALFFPEKGYDTVEWGE